MYGLPFLTRIFTQQDGSFVNVIRRENTTVRRNSLNTTKQEKSQYRSSELSH